MVRSRGAAEFNPCDRAGAHDALLLELIDCAAAVATGFVDWLHGDGALL